MDQKQGIPRSPLEKLRVILWAQLKAGESWIRERDLTQQQAFVLSFLVDNPGAIQRDIARETRTSPANITGVLRGLEARALIERRLEGGDERSKYVYATISGAELVCGRDEAMAAADEQILAPLSPADRLAFTQLLDQIAAELPEPDVR